MELYKISINHSVPTNNKRFDILFSYLEAQNDSPDETKTEPRVAVDDVMGPHVLQMNSLFAQKLKRLVHVLQAVDTHFTFRWTRLREDDH